ncbi:unnamed protein product [Closterium sp. NIES-65]|nr:unnamed protein product [Closterium sp. NIES-65]
MRKKADPQRAADTDCTVVAAPKWRYVQCNIKGMLAKREEQRANGSAAPTKAKQTAGRTGRDNMEDGISGDSRKASSSDKNHITLRSRRVRTSGSSESSGLLGGRLLAGNEPPVSAMFPVTAVTQSAASDVEQPHGASPCDKRRQSAEEGLSVYKRRRMSSLPPATHPLATLPTNAVRVSSAAPTGGEQSAGSTVSTAGAEAKAEWSSGDREAGSRDAPSAAALCAQGSQAQAQEQAGPQACAEASDGRQANGEWMGAVDPAGPAVLEVEVAGEVAVALHRVPPRAPPPARLLHPPVAFESSVEPATLRPAVCVVEAGGGAEVAAVAVLAASPVAGQAGSPHDSSHEHADGDSLGCGSDCAICFRASGEGDAAAVVQSCEGDAAGTRAGGKVGGDKESGDKGRDADGGDKESHGTDGSAKEGGAKVAATMPGPNGVIPRGPGSCGQASTALPALSPLAPMSDSPSLAHTGSGAPKPAGEAGSPCEAGSPWEIPGAGGQQRSEGKAEGGEKGGLERGVGGVQASHRMVAEKAEDACGEVMDACEQMGGEKGDGGARGGDFTADEKVVVRESGLKDLGMDEVEMKVPVEIEGAAVVKEEGSGDAEGDTGKASAGSREKKVGSREKKVGSSEKKVGSSGGVKREDEVTVKAERSGNEGGGLAEGEGRAVGGGGSEGGGEAAMLVDYPDEDDLACSKRRLFPDGPPLPAPPAAAPRPPLPPPPAPTGPAVAAARVQVKCEAGESEGVPVKRVTVTHAAAPAAAKAAAHARLDKKGGQQVREEAEGGAAAAAGQSDKSRLTPKRRRLIESYVDRLMADLQRPQWMELPLAGVDPRALIGRLCKVYWPLDERWYAGLVYAYDARTGKHQVRYDETESEWLRMAAERIKLHLPRHDPLLALCPTPPPPPPAAASAPPPAAAAAATCATGPPVEDCGKEECSRDGGEPGCEREEEQGREEEGEDERSGDEGEEDEDEEGGVELVGEGGKAGKGGKGRGWRGRRGWQGRGQGGRELAELAASMARDMDPARAAVLAAAAMLSASTRTAPRDHRAADQGSAPKAKAEGPGAGAGAGGGAVRWEGTGAGIAGGTGGPLEELKLGRFGAKELVWARVKGHPAWPAMVLDPAVAERVGLRAVREGGAGEVLVHFFGSYECSIVAASAACPFLLGLAKGLHNKSKAACFKTALHEVERFLLVEELPAKMAFLHGSGSEEGSDEGSEEESGSDGSSGEGSEGASEEGSERQSGSGEGSQSSGEEGKGAAEADEGEGHGRKGSRAAGSAGKSGAEVGGRAAVVGGKVVDGRGVGQAGASSGGCGEADGQGDGKVGEARRSGGQAVGSDAVMGGDSATTATSPPSLPLHIGSLTLLSLGAPPSSLTLLSLGRVLPGEPGFHTAQHIYPVGYKAVRPFPSAQGVFRPFPSAQGVFRPFPSAQGVFRPFPSAQGVFRPFPSAQGVFRPFPSAQGVFRPFPSAQGVFRPFPSAQGVFRPFPSAQAPAAAPFVPSGEGAWRRPQLRQTPQRMQQQQPKGGKKPQQKKQPPGASGTAGNTPVPGGPIFRVTPEGSDPVEGPSPGECWRIIQRRVAEAKRLLLQHLHPPSTGAGGGAGGGAGAVTGAGTGGGGTGGGEGRAQRGGGPMMVPLAVLLQRGEGSGGAVLRAGADAEGTGGGRTGAEAEAGDGSRAGAAEAGGGDGGKAGARAEEQERIAAVTSGGRGAEDGQAQIEGTQRTERDGGGGGREGAVGQGGAEAEAMEVDGGGGDERGDTAAGVQGASSQGGLPAGDPLRWAFPPASAARPLAASPSSAPPLTPSPLRPPWQALPAQGTGGGAAHGSGSPRCGGECGGVSGGWGGSGGSCGSGGSRGSGRCGAWLPSHHVRSGAQMFGLTHPRVAHLIQGLPNATRCHQFTAWVNAPRPAPASNTADASRGERARQASAPAKQQGEAAQGARAGAVVVKESRLPAGFKAVEYRQASLDRCDVCCLSEEYEDDQLLQCDSCRIMVHMACYGVREPPDGGLWLCDVCSKYERQGKRDAKPLCCLCPVQGGAMKRTVHGLWAHLACSLWIPETSFVNIKRMEPVTGFDDIPKARWQLRCCVCRIPHGACIQCAAGQCYTAFHPLCAKLKGYPMLTLDMSEESMERSRLHGTVVGSVAMICFCPRHRARAKALHTTPSLPPHPSAPSPSPEPTAAAAPPRPPFPASDPATSGAAAASPAPSDPPPKVLPMAQLLCHPSPSPLPSPSDAPAALGSGQAEGKEGMGGSKGDRGGGGREGERENGSSGGARAGREGKGGENEGGSGSGSESGWSESSGTGGGSSEGGCEMDSSRRDVPLGGRAGGERVLCARTEPFDARIRRGRREPDAVAAFLAKRSFLENVPFAICGRRQEQRRVHGPSVVEAVRAHMQHAASHPAQELGSKDGHVGTVGEGRGRAGQHEVCRDAEGVRDVGPGGGVHVSRLRRLLHSGLVGGAEGQEGQAGSGEGEVRSMSDRFRRMKSTQQQRLAFGKSAIHGWGVFAKTPHRAGDMIIEYGGEVVRPVVADLRERRCYDSLVGAGTYMFRIDSNRVVDATKAGTIAHLINHSCNPNCYSRVVQASAEERIVIFARRDIMAGEELTYDYRFDSQDEQLACNCGSSGCRGVVNILRGDDDDADGDVAMWAPRSELLPWQPPTAPL